MEKHVYAGFEIIYSEVEGKWIAKHPEGRKFDGSQLKWVKESIDKWTKKREKKKFQRIKGFHYNTFRPLEITSIAEIRRRDRPTVWISYKDKGEKADHYATMREQANIIDNPKGYGTAIIEDTEANRHKIEEIQNHKREIDRLKDEMTYVPVSAITDQEKDDYSDVHKGEMGKIKRKDSGTTMKDLTKAQDEFHAEREKTS